MNRKIELYLYISTRFERVMASYLIAKFRFGNAAFLDKLNLSLNYPS